MRTLITTASALLSWGILLSGAAQAEPARRVVPAEITGRFTIASAFGQPPYFLEVGDMAGLIGKTVEIERDLRLWDIYSGTIVSVAASSGRLRDQGQYPVEPTRHEEMEGQRTMTFYNIATTSCRSHDKPMAECPIITVARDSQTGAMGLVTFPYGLASFAPAAPR